MWDLTKGFVGASIAGRLLNGVVEARLSKDGVSLLNRDGENLLGAKAGVPEERGQAAGSSRLEQDVFRYMSAQSEGDEE
jgi:hypothetical protein